MTSETSSEGEVQINGFCTCLVIERPYKGVSLRDKQELACSALKSKYRISCIRIHVLPYPLGGHEASRLSGKDAADADGVLLIRRKGHARFGLTPLGYVDHLVGVR